MRVLLRPEVFTSAYRLELHVLLWLGSTGRHRVVPEPLDAAQHVAWVEGLDEETRRLWNDMVRDSLEREMFAPAHWEIAVTVATRPAWALPTPLVPVGAAVDLLLMPYRIVLENNIHDRAFLLALCGRDEARALATAEERAWLVFEMGGGSTVVPRIHEIRRSEALRRMVSALVDSDAMRPRLPGERVEDVEGDQARSVRAAAGDMLTGVHLHVLQRRAIENYLPFVALRRWARGSDERKGKVEALKSLSDPQRHHFNMKKGFDGDVPNAVRAGALYEGLPASVRDRLKTGFESDVARLFTRAVAVEDVDDAARAELREFVKDILARMR